MSISHFFFSRYILSKLASDCIPLFAFNLCSPLQLVHQERRGKFKMSQESECVIFKLPANSEHLVLRGGVRPRQWEPLSFPSTPRATAPPQGGQGGMCAFFKCVRVCLCVCVCVCVWTDSVPTGMTLNRHCYNSRSYCNLNFSSVCLEIQQLNLWITDVLISFHNIHLTVKNKSLSGEYMWKNALISPFKVWNGGSKQTKASEKTQMIECGLLSGNRPDVRPHRGGSNKRAPNQLKRLLQQQTRPDFTTDHQK